MLVLNEGIDSPHSGHNAADSSRLPHHAEGTINQLDSFFREVDINISLHLLTYLFHLVSGLIWGVRAEGKLAFTLFYFLL